MKKKATSEQLAEAAFTVPELVSHRTKAWRQIEAKLKAEEQKTREELDQVLLHKEMPALLFSLHELAAKAQVSTEVLLTPTGTEMKFFFDSYSEEVLSSVTSVRYEFDSIRSMLESRVQEVTAREARRVLAQNAMLKFTPEEVLALKEFPVYFPRA
jgi:hypothetical protein